MKRLEQSGKKRIIGAILAVVLVMGTALGVTLAYYHTGTDEIVNEFTIGNVTTELVEDFYQNPDNKTEFTKTPRVTNIGADPCLVRLRMTVTPEEIVDKYVVDKEGNPVVPNKKYLQIEGWSNEKWVLNKADGYLYYSDILQPGESTVPVFTNVTVNYDDANPWEDFDIILYQEAVQAEVNKGGQTITNADEIWKAYEELK